VEEEKRSERYVEGDLTISDKEEREREREERRLQKRER
jgi:hypothetical protein